jgi:hypothetical protein
MSTTTNTAENSSSKSKAGGRTFMDKVQQYSAAADRITEQDGKRMFRMLDGKSIELPPEMTVGEAIQLEADANAAQKRLGKTTPLPVPPDAKEVVKKKTKKPGPDKAMGDKGKKAQGKGGAGKKGAGIAGALGKFNIKGKVGAWLMTKGAPVVSKGLSKLAQLKSNEQQHEDAAAKLEHTQKAVVPPALEGQSKSNAGQVTKVDAKPTPQPNEAKAKQDFDKAVEDNIPKSIEDVDNFKRDNKAATMSAAAALAVNTDKAQVTTTFSEMATAPAPAPPEQVPQPLPPEEIAPVTAKMALGKDTVAPLQPEHTDVSNFTKEADSKLKDEGVTQDQLDMVDSGDLAEANKEKKGMEKKAKTEPAAVKQFASAANHKVDQELQQEENKGKADIQNQRKSKLGATKTRQLGAKSEIEKKREEVTSKINTIYKTAQDKVTKRLNDLETASMKRFDDGNAKANTEFDSSVKRELDAFKADRYSGFWGWAKKAKDWVMGMDDLPQVKAIFDRNRSTFVTKINALVAAISEDNKKVVQECKDELTNARTEIKTFVDKLGPDLKQAGMKAQSEMNDKLDELDKMVAKKEEELQNKLKDKQAAAIKAIDEKIEKMKEAMSGALSKLGKLLLLAAKKFFTWALEKFGFSLAEIEGIINKGAAVLKAIFTQPIPFVKNLINAAITGFKNFGKNFLKHLKDALFEWLTGSLEGLTLPAVWNFQGIISIALQMIGISYQNIRRHMVEAMGENVVVGLEKTFTLVKTLITEGPMAAWDQLKDMAAEMRDAFVDAVKDFIKTKIIEQAIQWVVSLFIPGAGIIKAIIGIYDTIVFFIQKAKQIMQMVGSFLSSIGAIAAGNIGAAADALENGLARGLSLVISFLAQLLHLNGVTDKIRNAIQKIKGKVDGVLAKVAKWIAEKAKKLIAPITAKVDQAKEWGKEKIEGLVNWLGLKKSFKTKNKETHSIFVEKQSNRPVLMIASQKQPFSQYLANLVVPATDAQKVKAKQDAITSNASIGSKLAELVGLENANPKTAKGILTQKQDEIRSEYDTLSNAVTVLGIGGAREETVQTVITPTTGSKLLNIEAKPLTALKGNTVGNPNANSVKGVPGWAFLDKINIAKSNDNTIYNDWVRWHLIHSALHGPAAVFNLVAAPRRVNTIFAGEVEHPAMRRVLEPGAMLYYKVQIAYGNTTSPLDEFPTNIKYVWGTMKMDDNNKPVEDTQVDTKTYTGFPLPSMPAVAGSVLTVVLKSAGRPFLQNTLKIPQDRANRIAAATAKYPAMTVYDAMDAYYALSTSLFNGTAFSQYLVGDKKAIVDAQTRFTGTYILDLK